MFCYFLAALPCCLGVDSVLPGCLAAVAAWCCPASAVLLLSGQKLTSHSFARLEQIISRRLEVGCLEIVMNRSRSSGCRAGLGAKSPERRSFVLFVAPIRLSLLISSASMAHRLLLALLQLFCVCSVYREYAEGCRYPCTACLLEIHAVAIIHCSS